jgi:hypothetical protein
MRQAFVLGNSRGELGEEFVKKMYSELKHASFWLGVLIHHDAITGTSTVELQQEYVDHFLETVDRMERV